MQVVRSVAASQSQFAASHSLPSTEIQTRDLGNSIGWETNGDCNQYAQIDIDWFRQQQDSASTPSASASVAAVRWFGLLANDASRDVLEEPDLPPGLEGGFLDLFNGQDEDDLTPLQRATRIIDGQPPGQVEDDGIQEKGMWQTPEDIPLLDREQILFKNFLHRICSWVCCRVLTLGIYKPAYFNIARPLRPCSHNIYQSTTSGSPQRGFAECNLGSIRIPSIAR